MYINRSLKKQKNISRKKIYNVITECIGFVQEKGGIKKCNTKMMNVISCR